MGLVLVCDKRQIHTGYKGPNAVEELQKPVTLRSPPAGWNFSTNLNGEESETLVGK
jgi:hypothetical protein